MLGQKQCVKCEILPGTVYLLKVSEKSVSIILPAWTPACFLDVWFLPPDCLWVMLLGLSLFCPTTITVQSDQASQLWVSLARVAIHCMSSIFPSWGGGLPGVQGLKTICEQINLLSIPSQPPTAVSPPITPVLLLSPSTMLFRCSWFMQPFHTQCSPVSELQPFPSEQSQEAYVIVTKKEKHPPLNWTWCSIVQLWAGRQLEAYSVQGGKRVIDYLDRWQKLSRMFLLFWMPSVTNLI